MRIVIAFFSIGYHAIHAADANNVDSLRYEYRSEQLTYVRR